MKKENLKFNKNNEKQNKQTKEKIEEMEDVTKYGEFVSSYFSWLNPEQQKEIAKKLENITKK